MKPSGCTIVSIRDKFHPPKERKRARREIAAVTSRDPEEVLEDASWLFSECGIQPDQTELQHEACITPEGKVLGVSALGLYTDEPHELDPLRRPRWRFSVAVAEKARRKGIARALIESILRSHPREKYLLEGKVVNPHMATFLTEKGFLYEFPEDYEGKEEWDDLDLRIGRTMYLPNPQRRDNPPPLESLRPALAAAAQRVYDAWEQDEQGHDESYGYGGICHDIAAAFGEVLSQHGIGSTDFNFTIGEHHVTCVADVGGEAWRVDVLPGTYETGAMYTWRKIPGVVFGPEDVLIEPMGHPFRDYLEFENNPPPWLAAVHPYVSPRERILEPHEAWVRAIAYGIKDGTPSSIGTAAAAMAPFVPEGAYMVPAPSSRAGSFGGVRLLAEAIARLVGGIYAEPVVRARTVTSSHERRRMGGVGLSVEDHLASMESRMRGPCPKDRQIVIVDNVVTTGATLEAVRRLLLAADPKCDVRAVVWAQARET